MGERAHTRSHETLWGARPTASRRARSLWAGIAALVFVAFWGLAGVAGAAEAPKLSDEQFERGKFMYFDRCSGCHGALRKGATGPNITDQQMLKQTTAKLEKTIYGGTDAGMPGWGRTGEMTRAETALMAKYLQLPAPIPPELGLKEMKATHKVYVPVAARPRKPSAHPAVV